MILGNVQSLRNKVDELQGNVAFLKDFRDCCVLAFTETWLMENDQDTDLSIDGFGAPYRLDRQAEVTRKSQGGGVCLYVNRCYCTSVTVRERISTPDVELLSVSLRPFYLSREFPQLQYTFTQGRILRRRLIPSSMPCRKCSRSHPRPPTSYWVILIM